MKTSADLLGPQAPRRAAHPSAARRALCSLTLLFVALLIAGCGDVEWFPDYVRLPTTPNDFSFPAKKGVEKNGQVTSDAITVAGLTAASSPISIVGSSGSASKYSIGGGTPTDAAGTVKNGDVVTVTHTAANALGATTISTLTIGTVSANFSSTTRYLEVPSFVASEISGSYRRSYAVIISSDGASGTHEIKVRDSLDSGNAQFGVSDLGAEPSTWFSTTQTIPFLNGRRLWVRNQIVTVATPATTTVTVDGIDYQVPLAP